MSLLYAVGQFGDLPLDRADAVIALLKRQTVNLLRISALVPVNGGDLREAVPDRGLKTRDL